MGTYDTRGGAARHDPSAADGDPSELSDKILGLLEEAGISTEINDRITRLIELGEQRKAGEHNGRETVERALMALCPYADPRNDPDRGRGDAIKIVRRELGLPARG